MGPTRFENRPSAHPSDGLKGQDAGKHQLMHIRIASFLSLSRPAVCAPAFHRPSLRHKPVSSGLLCGCPRSSKGTATTRGPTLCRNAPVGPPRFPKAIILKFFGEPLFRSMPWRIEGGERHEPPSADGRAPASMRFSFEYGDMSPNRRKDVISRRSSLLP